MPRRINVIMCGSKLSVGGGMVSVIQNYLDCEDWKNANIHIDYIPTHIDSNMIFKSMFFVIAYFRIAIITLFKKYDIGHLHTTENGSFFRKALILKLLKKRDVKVILHHHIDYEDFYSRQTQKKKKYIDDILTAADLNIILGDYFRIFFSEHAPLAKIKVVYNAVKIYSTNMYNVNANHVLFFGWLIERKGISDLLNAIKELDSKADTELKFNLCGDGEKEIYEKIDKLCISHRISHIGWINPNDREEYFKDSFVNVLPSYREGLPMTILESMAYGIPSITTKIAIIPEVVKNLENGVLIEPGDINKLVENIMLLYNNKALRSELSNNAYKTICEKFSIKEHLVRVKNIYSEMVEVDVQ